MRVSRGVEKYARQSTLKDTENNSSGAVLSPKSPSCGRPRAQTQGDQSQVRYKAAPKPKLVSIMLSQRIRKTIPAEAKLERDCESKKQIPNTSRRFYDTEVDMMLTEQYDGHRW